MFPLFETIHIENGIIQHPNWHEKRYEKSYYTCFKKIPISPLLTAIYIPPDFQKGTVKLKVKYSENSKEFSFEKYQPKPIQSLKLVVDNSISYSLKYTNRSTINFLLTKKETCDDILIIKEGCITDTSYTNIIFYDGQQWITPSTPLLKGTCRARLLHDKKIYTERILLKDLKDFQGFQLINAMLEFNPNHMIPIDKIKS